MDLNATIERHKELRRAREADLARAVYACGWCKGFIHQARVSDMLRYVHDEPPATAHEVLPYRVR